MDKNLKHAFLIMAREYSEQLVNLIKALDYPDNDIFVHIDKKSGLFHSINTEHAGLIFTERIKVSWAGFSQIKAELILLKSAKKINNYKYYHLLSESDLPIKSNAYIHRYFANRNEEYIYLSSVDDNRILDRIKYYYPLQDLVGKSHGLLWGLQKTIYYIQKLVRIDRLKKSRFSHYGKGAQWFSITDDFVNCIIKQEQSIIQYFKFGKAIDEMVLQTLLINSEFKDRLSNSEDNNLRYTIWKTNNSPEILTEINFPDLMASPKLFARKFNMQKDKSMIQIVSKYIKIN